MTDRIQHTTELITDRSVGIFTLIATSEHVRGVRETDLIEVHNVNTGEMFEMADWEASHSAAPHQWWKRLGKWPISKPPGSGSSPAAST